MSYVYLLFDYANKLIEEGEDSNLKRYLGFSLIEAYSWYFYLVEMFFNFIPPTYLLSKVKPVFLGWFLFKKIGHGCIINTPCQFSPLLVIGDNVKINRFCIFGGNADIVIEDGAVIANSVHVMSSKHEYGDADCRAGKIVGIKTVIKKGAWIGANVIVLPGITIGQGSLVGAGSIVTKDVPDYVVVAGNPAKIIKQLETKPSSLN